MAGKGGVALNETWVGRGGWGYRQAELFIEINAIWTSFLWSRGCGTLFVCPNAAQPKWAD